MGEQHTITQMRWEQDQAVVLQSISMEIDRKLAQHPGEALAWSLSKLERHRTNAQNDFMWPMIRQIANAVGASEQSMKMELLSEVYGVKLENRNGKEYKLYPQTSKFTVKQMHHFIERSMAYASTVHGVSVMLAPDYKDWAARAER